MPQDLETSYEPVFIARQPVFRADLKLWGYELLFRHCNETQIAVFQDPDQATSKVIIDGYTLAQGEGLPQQIKILINFPRRALLDGSAQVLPRKQIIIEVLEDVLPDKEVLQACMQLKQQGYQLALDDFKGQSRYQKLLQFMDIVKIDVLALQENDLASVLKDLQNFPCKILTEKIQTKSMFRQCLELGSHLFQGFFFSRPEIIPGRAIPAHQSLKLRLLGLLSKQEDLEPKELAKIIQNELSLSYKLLKFINSPFVGLQYKIESIPRAIYFLGTPKVVHWLKVLILTEFNSSSRGLQLAQISAQRGKFLQLISQETPHPPLPPEAMFLLGLFSLLDAVLDQPMQDILAHLPLHEDLVHALLGEDTVAGKWLQLALAQEQADWPRLLEILQSLELPQDKSAVCYTQSMRWADQLTGLHA